MMIKEYIEDLPGGKQFIKAQRELGAMRGALVGRLVGFLIGLLMLIKILSILDENNVLIRTPSNGQLVSEIAINAILIHSFYLVFAFIILLIFEYILYYINSNKADNIYKSHVKKENE